MAKKRKGVIRPTATKDAALTHLRAQIACGVLRLGSRLPVRIQLARDLRISQSTLQRVIDGLAAEGFVQTRGKLGTFVVERPPFVDTYALVFPFDPQIPHEWTKFNATLLAAAADLLKSGLKLPSYYNILQYHSLDSPSHNQLVKDIVEHRIGGIIFASPPHNVVTSPIMTHPGIPRVVMGTFPGLWGVDLAGVSFYTKALDYFAARGRKRLAIVSVPRLAPCQGDNDSYVREAQARSIKLEFWSRQFVWQGYPLAAENAVAALMHGPADSRPDALLIWDDNLVEHAVIGLIRSGFHVGADVDVVAHANYPIASPSALPVRRLGYDAREVLARCIEAIRAQHQGERQPRQAHVDPVWDQDISPSNQ